MDRVSSQAPTSGVAPITLLVGHGADEDVDLVPYPVSSDVVADVTMARFTTQAPALEFAASWPSLRMFAEEINGEGGRVYLVSSLEGFWRAYRGGSKHNW